MKNSENLIYILDNDKQINILIKEKLKKEGFNVETFLKGDDLLNKLNNDKKILLILDYKLKEMTAEIFLEKLSERDLNFPFIVMTGLDDIKIAIKMMRMGAKDYLIKDLNFLNLLPTVVNRVLTEIGKEEIIMNIKNDLSESEETARVLLNTSPDAMALLSTEGIILDANESTSKQFGIEVPDIIGKSIFDFFPEENTENLKQVIKKVIKDVRQVRFEEQRANRIYDNILYPVVNIKGKVIKVSILIRDLTEIRKMEDEMRDKEMMQHRLDRLISLSNLTSAINHEIKQPLNSIKVISESILYLNEINKKLKYEELLGDFKKISNRVKRITDIIQSMRVLMKAPNELTITNLDIEEQINQSIKLVKQKMDELKIDFILDIEEKSLTGVGSEILFQRVIINLIDNAIRALGTVNKKNKKIIIKAYKEADEIVIKIIDNGPGIENKHKEDIFDPFKSYIKSNENMGMGLFIIKNIIRSFNAKIEVVDNEYNGATFTIYLKAGVS